MIQNQVLLTKKGRVLRVVSSLCQVCEWTFGLLGCSLLCIEVLWLQATAVDPGLYRKKKLGLEKSARCCSENLELVEKLGLGKDRNRTFTQIFRTVSLGFIIRLILLRSLRPSFFSGCVSPLKVYVLAESNWWCFHMTTSAGP